MLKRTFLVLLLLLFVLSWMRCRTSTEPFDITALLKGTVRSTDDRIIHPAYLFVQDSLLAVTDEAGTYSIIPTGEGLMELTCSALDYKDTTVQVLIEKRRTYTVDFIIAPDSTIGRVYGEFQDQVLFTEAVNIDSSLKDWDAKNIFDAATGATLQFKTLGYEPGHRRLFLGDSLLATSDAWAQFFFRIQCGTYPISATVAGYDSKTTVVRVLPEVRNYVNFFMERDNLAAPASP